MKKRRTAFEDRKWTIGTKDYETYRKLFSEAGAHAVLESKRLGLPVTGVKGGKIVTEYPDGREEILGDAPPPVRVTKTFYDLSGLKPE